MRCFDYVERHKYNPVAQPYCYDFKAVPPQPYSSLLIQWIGKTVESGGFSNTERKCANIWASTQNAVSANYSNMI